ncbi:MAG: glycosyltransferase family 4 protein [Paludibacteraceae bacterium]|nr:glycosyltransferase family 4 protein [Paludibacteraceae bacterium]
MNILFITLADIDLSQHGIYSDLVRYFTRQGHEMYIVSPVERRHHKNTSYTTKENIHLLSVKTLNIQKTNVIEKGVGTILLERQFCNAIRRFLSHIKFDIMLYSTPPITLSKVIKYVKRTNKGVITYLLLKDIFPQNAVDLGMLSKEGLLYRYFRKKERDLYMLSDYIGCMSPANKTFLLTHNPYIDAAKVEIAPNSIELHNDMIADRKSILEKYNIPTDKTIFVYGGNLGKPQGIPFLIECLDNNSTRKDCHFIIVGNGTEYGKLDRWYKAASPGNVTLLSRLPKDEYDHLIQACHVGLIFLDYKFTIPNFPSRLLPYLQYKMPIIAATDPNTDVGQIAQTNHFGYACLSNEAEAFSMCIDKMLSSDIKEMGENGYKYLAEHYTVANTYNTIIAHTK